MVKVRDIEELMEKIAPLSLKEKWDNVGLQAGDRDSIVSGILLSLDLTSEVIKEAENYGCNLILCHHPLIMSPIYNIVAGEPISDMLLRLIRENINFFCAHTNLDKAVGGVNDCLAERLGLHDITELSPDDEGALCRIGTLPSEMTLGDFALLVKENLRCPAVRFSGKKDKRIKTVALCSGAGSEFYSEAAENGADVFVTGEVKHHVALYGEELGISFVEAGHFETEAIVLDELYEKITAEFDIPVYISERHNGFFDAV